jgi:hypothetical protein
LVISRVTSFLVYNICRGILLLWGSKCIRHWWPGLRRQLPSVTPQSRSCWRILVLHNFLHHAQCNALKGIHQTFRMAM